jgi:hypothetical protein
LPSKVIGPVLFLALARFANTFFNEITFVTPFFFLYLVIESSWILQMKISKAKVSYETIARISDFLIN